MPIIVISRWQTWFGFPAAETSGAAMNFDPPAHPLSICETGPIRSVGPDTDRMSGGQRKLKNPVVYVTNSNTISGARTNLQCESFRCAPTEFKKTLANDLERASSWEKPFTRIQPRIPMKVIGKRCPII
jgi:hypothetical protein